LGAFDLLEVLQAPAGQLDHLDGQTGGAGDPHRRVLVGREDLLDVALCDDVAHGGPAVTGEHHAAGERDGDDGRAVRGLDDALGGRQLPVAGSISGCWSERKSMKDDDPGVRKAAGRRPVLRVLASTRILPSRRQPDEQRRDHLPTCRWPNCS